LADGTTPHAPVDPPRPGRVAALAARSRRHAALRHRLRRVRRVDARDAERRPGAGQRVRRLRAPPRAPTGDAIRATRAARRPQHLRFDLRAEQTRPVVCRAGHIHWRELASGRSSRHDGPVMTLIAALPDSDDPTAVFDAFSGWVADQGITLYPHQEEALIEIVSGSNVILNTPTGSGKSLVATGAHFAAIATDR